MGCTLWGWWRPTILTMPDLSHHDLTVTIRHLRSQPVDDLCDLRAELWWFTAEYLGDICCLPGWGDLTRSAAQTGAHVKANLPEKTNAQSAQRWAPLSEPLHSSVP